MKKQTRWCKAFVGLLKESRLSPAARLTLLVLRSYCSKDRNTCYPKTDTLCADMGCDRKAMFRYLNELESLGWIRRTARRRTNNAFRSTLYELLDERKSLVKEAIPCSHNGDTATSPDIQVVKYSLSTREKTPFKRRKIIPLPCPQNGDAIKSI